MGRSGTWVGLEHGYVYDKGRSGNLVALGIGSVWDLYRPGTYGGWAAGTRVLVSMAHG